MKRKIVRIDEEKCNGCGLCVPSCHEGAIQVVDGKARLVSDVYCDGLGDCLDECPQGAITIVEREADAYDERAVQARLAARGVEGLLHHPAVPQTRKAGAQAGEPAPHRPAAGPRRAAPAACPSAAGGCPGAAVRALRTEGAPRPADVAPTSASPSALANWPVQLMLAPVDAPYFKDAHLLLAADCTAFAFADFHRALLEGKTLLVCCPKLDRTDVYFDKLVEIFRRNEVSAVEVVHMEVPCCYALRRLVEDSLEASGRRAPLTVTRLGIRGDIQERTTLNGGEAR